MVIDEKNRIMLVQKKNYSQDEWDFPGGGVEKNETEEQAIVRELGEELGTNKFSIIKKSSMTDQYEWPDKVIKRKLKELGKTWRGQQRTQFLIKFLGVSGDINFQKNELRQIKWVSIAELPNYLLFPGQLTKAKELLVEFKL